MPPAPRPPENESSRGSAAEAARRALSLETASAERRRRLLHRFVPVLLALAIVAFILGLIVAAGESPEERTARAYVGAWERGNYPAMYQLLTPGARSSITLQAFTDAYRNAAATATTARFEVGKAEGGGDGATVPMRVVTRIFGTIDARLDIPVHEEKVAWRPEMVFPGLRPGERLSRHTRAPERAKILARNGAKIVSGPAAHRTPGPGAASSIAGSM